MAQLSDLIQRTMAEAKDRVKTASTVQETPPSADPTLIEVSEVDKLAQAVDYLGDHLGYIVDDRSQHEKLAEKLALGSIKSAAVDEAIAGPGEGDTALTNNYTTDPPKEGLLNFTASANAQLPKETAGKQKDPETPSATLMENTRHKPQGKGEAYWMTQADAPFVKTPTSAKIAFVKKMAETIMNLNKSAEDGETASVEAPEVAKVEKKPDLNIIEKMDDGEEKAAALRNYLMGKVAESATLDDSLHKEELGYSATASEEEGKKEKRTQPTGVDGAKKSLVTGSLEKVINYTKGEAKAPQKTLMKEVLSEPALTTSTDDVLQAAFENTSKAGVKISSQLGVEVGTLAEAILQHGTEEQKTKLAGFVQSKLAEKQASDVEGTYPCEKCGGEVAKSDGVCSSCGERNAPPEQEGGEPTAPQMA